MDNSLILLCKVKNLDDQTAAYCAQHERKMPYIHDGFVSADWPRAVAYTEAIREATVGYAIADEDGKVIREFKTLANADKARAGSRTVLAVEIDDEDDSDEPATKAAVKK